MIADSTPILIGCGDVTDLTTPVQSARSPMDLISKAGRKALQDAGPADLVNAIDTVAILQLFADAAPRFRSKFGGSSNPPKSVAQRLGISANRHIYTRTGGNMPQYLVNFLSEAIAKGEIRAALIAGGEALRTQHGMERYGLTADWNEDPGGQPELVGDPRRGLSDYEERHNMWAAITMYPLIENAIRGGRRCSIPDHLNSMGRLFARFAEVAAANPLAARRDGYSATRLATVDDDNRWIGFPYPRLMNANVFVDQAGALILTSAGQARRLGTPENKWVYLHGCADGGDHWYVSDRVNLNSSPAIRSGSRKALAMAGKTLADMRFFDLYSCFPSAVEIGCAEMGLAEDDSRGLTVTGGLPYFGGPGNSYVVNSISEMVRRLRGAPGSFGLVTANGYYVTKHSFGVYSTQPFHGTWQRESPAVLQAELDATAKAPLVEKAAGPAIIETYTVMYGKDGPEFSVVIGRLKDNGHRFLANTPHDPAVLKDLQGRESLGRPGTVRPEDGRNVFIPE